MAFKVTIDKFEGPLDLMLHLIKENKLDLEDLDMNVLTTQYLNYIKAMESLSLEIASEYLSELAGLVEYKSKKMLPRETIVIEEEFEEDQREKLARRLMEYKKYKEVSKVFNEKYEERQKSFEKPLSAIAKTYAIPNEEFELRADAYDLIKAMQKVMKRFQMKRPMETNLTVNEMSLDERRDQVKVRLMNFTNKITFEDLCNDCDSNHMIIVTFLSILDLIKTKFITFTLDNEDRIWILRSI